MFSIHFCGDIVKAFDPACITSTCLVFVLYNASQKTISLGNIDPIFYKNHLPSTTVHSLVREIMDIIQNKRLQ